MRLIDGDELWNKAYEVWGLEADAGDTSIFMDMITDAPTIDPVKHGRWKEITYHNGCTPDYDCVCSECGTSGVPYDEYCPGCGARMDANE